MKKKLVYSSVPVLDVILTQAYKKYEQKTGMPSEHISKKALVNQIILAYIKESL